MKRKLCHAKAPWKWSTSRWQTTCRGLAWVARAVLLASGFMRYDGVETVADALGCFKNAVELKAVFKEATPKAYRRLRELEFDVRVGDRLHAKFYLFVFGGEYVAVVGSSNLLMRGLVTNREVNIVMRGARQTLFINA